MANGVALLEAHGRKGKLAILMRHPFAFMHYLRSNGLGDTHIRFDHKIDYPYAKKGEKRTFREMFEAEFEKQNSQKERTQ